MALTRSCTGRWQCERTSSVWRYMHDVKISPSFGTCSEVATAPCTLQWVLVLTQKFRFASSRRQAAAMHIAFLNATTQNFGEVIRRPLLHVPCRVAVQTPFRVLKGVRLCWSALYSGINKKGSHFATLLPWKRNCVPLHTGQALKFVPVLAKLAFCKGTVPPPCAVSPPDLSNKKYLGSLAMQNLTQTMHPCLLGSIKKGSTQQPTYNRYYSTI